MSVIRFFLFFFQWPAASQALGLPGGARLERRQGGDAPPPKVLWRGEYTRDPKTVVEARTMNARDYDEILSEKADGFSVERGASLFNHAKGGASLYVSTAPDPNVALEAAQVDDAELDGGRYLYRIRPSKRAIPINKSLGQRSPFPEQDEYAYLASIPFDDFDGYFTLTPANKDEVMEAIRRGEWLNNRYFTPMNPQPDAPTEVAEPQYKLAGFARDEAGVWDEATYAPFRGRRIADFAYEFLESVGLGNRVAALRTHETTRRAKANDNSWSYEYSELHEELVGSDDSDDSDGSDGSGDESDGSESSGDESDGPEPPAKRPRICERDGVICDADEELVAAAEAASEREFVDTMLARGLTPLAKASWDLSPADLRAKHLGYTRLVSSSPELRATSVGEVTSRLRGLGGGTALAVLMWAPGVIKSFVDDSSAWDRLAAVTSILPLAGCAANAAAGADGIDSALCLLGDGLILAGPLTGGVSAAVGVVVHIVRSIVQAFQAPKELPTAEEVQKRRDDAWHSFLTKGLYNYTYSHDYYFKGRATTFASKLEGALVVEAAGMLSVGARAVGAVNATSERAVRAAPSDGEATKIQQGVEASIKEIRGVAWDQAISRQRRLLISMPATLLDEKHLSLKAIAEKYNADLVEQVTSFKNIQKYPRPGLLDGVAPTVPSDPYAEATARMADIAKHLRRNPIRLPTRVEAAFVMGQTRGLQLDPAVISPREYMAEHLPGWASGAVETALIHQASNTFLQLQGVTDHPSLARPPPVGDAAVQDGLAMVTSLRLGQDYEQRTNDVLNEHYKDVYKDGSFFLDATPAVIESITLPMVPPLRAPNINNVRYAVIPAALGILKTVSDAALHDLDNKKSKHLASAVNSFESRFIDAMLAEAQRLREAGEFP